MNSAQLPLLFCKCKFKDLDSYFNQRQTELYFKNLFQNMYQKLDTGKHKICGTFGVIFFQLKDRQLAGLLIHI